MAIHACLVGCTLAEGRAQEGRVKIPLEEEEECLERSFHSTLLLGKLSQTIYQSSNRKGREGVVFSLWT